MSDSKVFGPFVTGSMVEQAVEDTLKLWVPDYLAWAERETGREQGSIPKPRSYVRATEIDRWPEEQLPSVLILSTGFADAPRRNGSGAYRATYAVGLVVVVQASDRKAADDLAKTYIGALARILIHKSSLGGVASAVEWRDERYDALPDRKRTLAAGQGVFRIEVDEIAQSRMGPDAPSVDPTSPPDDPYQAVTVEAEIDPVALGD